MKLHPVSPRFKELLDLRVIGQGCFALVLEYDATSVLKITSCEVTQRLLDSALSSPKTWPKGLPAVYKRFGVMAEDEEGIQYKGYLIERLFTPEDWESGAVPRMRSVINSKSVRKTGRSADTCSTEPEIKLLHRLLAAAERFQPCPDEAPAIAQKTFALKMAAETQGGLRQAFLYLAHFVKEGGVAFDLTRAENLRLDCFGRVKLCDPASYSGAQAETPEITHFVLAEVPIALHGFQVTLRPAVRQYTSERQAEIARTELGHLGVIVTVTKDPAEVSQFMARPDGQGTVFEWPRVAQRLANGDYLAPFEREES